MKEGTLPGTGGLRGIPNVVPRTAPSSWRVWGRGGGTERGAKGSEKLCLEHCQRPLTPHPTFPLVTHPQVWPTFGGPGAIVTSEAHKPYAQIETSNKPLWNDLKGQVRIDHFCVVQNVCSWSPFLPTPSSFHIT